jgi:signal transduction histidine kinase
LGRPIVISVWRSSIVALLSIASKAIELPLPRSGAYKHATSQLSADLTGATDERQVIAIVESTVRRWVPCESVALRIEGREDSPAAETDRSDSLRLPMCFQGKAIGCLLLVGTPRHGLAKADLDLLRTIADQAALALAYARLCADIEERRKRRTLGSQIERAALVETVAAEIAHEIRYPINFFRSVFHRDRRNAKLEDEDIDIGCEEVERLERLVSGLRRIPTSRIDRRCVPVGNLAARVETLLRDVAGERLLAVDVPADAALRCDPHQATQLLVNLVANAIEATSPVGRIGVEWSVVPNGAKLVVWDDGLGFQGDEARLFVPWFTTKPRGTGLGLAIAQRIAHAHGWNIEADRGQGRTRFIVSVPASDVLVARTENLDCALSAQGRDERHEDTDRR